MGEGSVAGARRKPPLLTHEVRISNSRYDFAISRRHSPEVCHQYPALSIQRARGMPGADAPAAKIARVVRHGHTGNTRHPRAMVYGLLRALVSAKSARMCERAVLTNRPSLNLSPWCSKAARA